MIAEANLRVPLPFNHRCLSDEEVSAARAEIAPVAPLKKVMGITPTGTVVFYLGLACVLGIFALFGGCTLAPDPVADDVALTGFAVASLAFVIFWPCYRSSEARKEDKWRFRREQAEFEEADTEDLLALAEMGKRYPAIKAACAEWLANGHKIRARDVRAARAYTVRQAPRDQRESALEALRLA